MLRERLYAAAKAVQSLAIRRKGMFAAAAAVGAAACIFYIVSAPVFVGTSATERVLPIYRVARDNKSVSLTFDMSFGSEDTHHVIEALERYNVKATFFVVGEWAREHPEAVLALHEAGHEIMNHSDTHPNLSRLTADRIRAEAEMCGDTVEKLTGQRPTLFRCPYGEYDDNVILTLDSMELSTVQWDVDSFDRRGISAEEMTERIADKVRPGSIVLMHGDVPNTRQALPDIIESLIRNGYSIVPVSELLLSGASAVDIAGAQHAA